MEINVYVIEDDDGGQEEFDSYNDAVVEARKRRNRGERCAVMELEFEFSDSALVDPDLDVWKPANAG